MARLSKKQQEANRESSEKYRHLNHMANPEAWYHEPIQPMKRSNATRGPDLGFLVKGHGPTIFRCAGGIFTLQGVRPEDFSQEHYESYEHAYNCGWRVD